MHTPTMIPIGEFIQKQHELDQFIEAKHPYEHTHAKYSDRTRIIERISACAVEVGEAMNEWRKFKYWSQSQEPRTEKLYEELADVFHFILGLYPIIAPNIAYEGITHTYTPPIHPASDVPSACRTWLRLYEHVLHLAHVFEETELYGIFYGPNRTDTLRHPQTEKAWFEALNCYFDVLGVSGMSYAELCARYESKYAENIRRQENAY